MRVFFSDHHEVPLPDGHRFPMRKYRMLREALLARRVLRPEQLVASDPAPIAAPLRVHDADYVHRFTNGAMDERAVRKMGFPWSRALVARTLASLNGTVRAAWAALEDGISGNLAGGTHHAFRDEASGFCIFNDIAVATQTLLDEGAVDRVLVFDCDVHQGDGTAAIFADDPRVFTCSLHGERNFPFRKQTSDLDVALPDGTGDSGFIIAVERALRHCFERIEPDIVFFQAGVDALREDKLGRLDISHEGMRHRDEVVLVAARRREVPIVLTLGGGYADPLTPTIDAHVNTYRAALQVFPGARLSSVC